MASALCLPGVICWCAFLVNVLPRSIRGDARSFPLFHVHVVLPCWVLAVLMAAFSLLYFSRRQRSWYVRLNLLINISGLLFTVGIVVFMLVGAVIAEARGIPTWLD